MMALSLLDKLKVGRTEGKKGSKVKLVWNDAEKADFEAIKKALTGTLSLKVINPEWPFCVAHGCIQFCSGSSFGTGTSSSRDAYVGRGGSQHYGSSDFYVQEDDHATAEDMDHAREGGICSGECFGKMGRLHWRQSSVGVDRSSHIGGMG